MMQFRSGFLARSFTLLVIVFCCGLTNALAGDDRIQVWCKQDADPNHLLSWTALRDSLQPLAINNNYGAAYDFILSQYDAAQQSVVESGDGVSDDLQSSTAFRRELQAFSQGAAPRASFQFHLGGQFGETNLLKLQHEKTEIRFDCNTAPSDLAHSRPRLANIGYAAYAVFVLSGRELERLFGATAQVIDDRSRGYRAWLLDGLPMWPWELFVNGLIAQHGEKIHPPPRTQWVVARPSAGIEVTWPSQRDAELDASLGLEPLGFVRYRGKDYKCWWGISALVTLGSNDNGAAFGGLLRYDNYALGIVKRKDIDDYYGFINVDLFNLVNSTQQRLSKAEAILSNLRSR